MADNRYACLVEMDGRWQTYQEWSDELGVSVERLRERANRCGRLDGGKTARAEAYDGARELPWENDRVARKLVCEFGVMSHAQVGVVMGLTGERIRQIELMALKKLRREFAMSGHAISLVDALRMLSNKREYVYPDHPDGSR